MVVGIASFSATNVEGVIEPSHCSVKRIPRHLPASCPLRVIVRDQCRERNEASVAAGVKTFNISVPMDARREVMLEIVRGIKMTIAIIAVEVVRGIAAMETKLEVVVEVKLAGDALAVLGAVVSMPIP